ncbi:hypothetical protein MPSEU_000615700 [Mayamaea pseudoterrestris]|nr:hypothetical protein MPSEU_000615700 [Mayamaea pseudoterrestris]
MSSNPLIGKRISLVSKKNIRYEGILYSINEQNATVALQNVVSYGTEGREAPAFVAPSVDAIHPFLLFRGQDIKDLHVHEASAAAANENAEAATSDATKDTTSAPAVVAPTPPPASPPKPTEPAASTAAAASVPADINSRSKPAAPPSAGSKNDSRNSTTTAPPKQPNQRSNDALVGTGASLLGAQARGVKGPQKKWENPVGDFDFAANQKQFGSDEDDDEEEAGDELPPAQATGYNPSKSSDGNMNDGFFDSISCDALDKERGIDHRLRNVQERHLNTETFGAVALNTNKQGRGRGRGGRYNNSNQSNYNRRGGGRGEGAGRGGATEGRGGASGRGRSGGRGRGRGGRESSYGRGTEYAQGSANVRGRGRGGSQQQRQPTTAAVSG